MAGTPWNRVALGALAVLAALAVLLVVTDDPAPDPRPPAPPEPPRLLFGGALWTMPGGLSQTPGSPGVRDGLALVSQDGVTLVELATGMPRWHVLAGERLAGSADTYSSGGTLLGSGVLVRTRSGIAVLSRADGTVRWRAPVHAGAGERYVPVAADDRVVLVTIGPVRGGAPRVIAFDTATGRQRWLRAGLTPYSIAGPVVVGVTPPGTVAAWHLADGTPAWTLAGFTAARVALTAGGAVLVEGDAGGARPVRRVVAAATGEVLADLGGDPRTGPCAADTGTLIACPRARGPGDLVFETYDVGAGRVGTVASHQQPRAVCLVARDRLFGASERSYFAVTGRGRPVADHLPGRPVAVSGDYLVLRGDGGDPPLTSVYRMRK
jgi:outer membrane protein assembly factor BamB